MAAAAAAAPRRAGRQAFAAGRARARGRTRAHRGGLVGRLRAAPRLLRRAQRTRRDILDLPRASRRPGLVPAWSLRVIPGYAELHCLTSYSFLRGASSPEELVHRASELGYRAIAIT